MTKLEVIEQFLDGITADWPSMEARGRYLREEAERLCLMLDDVAESPTAPPS